MRNTITHRPFTLITVIVLNIRNLPLLFLVILSSLDLDLIVKSVYNRVDLSVRQTIDLTSPVTVHTKLVFGSLILNNINSAEIRGQSQNIHEVGTGIVNDRDLPWSRGETDFNILTLDANADQSMR